MKIYLFLLLSSLGLPVLAQTDSTPGPKVIVYTVVEQQPEFTGGMAALGRYMRRNLQYPQVARQAKIKGRVFITFVITDTGTIEDVKALNSLSPECDQEAIRMVKEMPRWKPGQQGGKPVYVRYNLPVRFPADFD